MANGHSLIPLLLPAPRRRQPISSKTRPPTRALPAIPSANGSKLRRPNNQPAGCAENFSMRLACRIGRRSPKKEPGKKPREKREWVMGDGEGRRETIQERRPRDRAKPAGKAQRPRQGFCNARDACAPVPQRRRPSGARRAGLSYPNYELLFVH